MQGHAVISIIIILITVVQIMNVQLAFVQYKLLIFNFPLPSRHKYIKIKKKKLFYLTDNFKIKFSI